MMINGKIVLDYLSSTEQHKAGQVSFQFPPSIALPPFTCYSSWQKICLLSLIPIRIKTLSNFENIKASENI